MASEPRVCPRCGSPVAASQEICIECGEQLGNRQPSGGWLVPAAAALAVAAAAAAVVIAIGKDDGAQSVVAPPLTSVATTATPTTATPTTATPTTATPTTATPTTATPTTATPTTATTVAGTTTAPATAPRATTAATQPGTTSAATPTTAPAPPGARLVVWPARTDGFTVVIASLPTAFGAGQATARALAVAKLGLPQTGVLVSDDFASLHPGYLVIFSGIYATLDEARRAAPAVQRLFPGAYSRRITH